MLVAKICYKQVGMLFRLCHSKKKRHPERCPSIYLHNCLVTKLKLNLRIAVRISHELRPVVKLVRWPLGRKKRQWEQEVFLRAPTPL